MDHYGRGPELSEILCEPWRAETNREIRASFGDSSVSVQSPGAGSPPSSRSTASAAARCVACHGFSAHAEPPTIECAFLATKKNAASAHVVVARHAKAVELVCDVGIDRLRCGNISRASGWISVHLLREAATVQRVRILGVYPQGLIVVRYRAVQPTALQIYEPSSIPAPVSWEQILLISLVSAQRVAIQAEKNLLIDSVSHVPQQ